MNVMLFATMDLVHLAQLCLLYHAGVKQVALSCHVMSSMPVLHLGATFKRFYASNINSRHFLQKTRELLVVVLVEVVIVVVVVVILRLWMQLLLLRKMCTTLCPK